MRIISLFSGAGGLDLGFIQAGHQVVWANDRYHDACATYLCNIGHAMHEGDIHDVDTATLPPAEKVIGGFPCQDFSIANMKRHVADARNKLYLEMLRIVAGVKPLFVLGENVKGITSLAKGQVFEGILGDFHALGYRVQYRVLDAANYGVPQHRERVFIVGVREDVDYRYVYPHPTYAAFPGLGQQPWRCVDDVLMGLPDPDGAHEDPNHRYSRFKFKDNGYLGHRPVDGSKPAPCVTGRDDNKGGVVVLPHPHAMRCMTGREPALIQGFPMQYVFEGSLSSVYRQIANAVPVGLAKAMGASFPLETKGIKSREDNADTRLCAHKE